MVTIAIAIIVIAAFAAIAYPIFSDSRENGSTGQRPSDPGLESLVVQREVAYAAIKDLEQDHAMGKLSDDDYRSMRTKYEAKAVAVLQEMDAIKSSSRNAPGAASDDAIESEVRKLRHGAQPPSLQCRQCGTACKSGDVFCGKCGASLRGARCPNCGTRAAIGDKFCARCGGRIGALS